MNNYALDTPIKRKVYVPEEDNIPFAPVKHSTETDQTHRNMTWLLHKPQDHALSPRPESVKKK